MKRYLPSPPSSALWNNTICALPGTHLLQTAEWARVKEQVGWKQYYLVWCIQNETTTFHINQWPVGHQVQAAALVLQRSLSFARVTTPLRILYIPKGPLLNWDDLLLGQRVISDIQSFAHTQGAIFIKIDPDVRLGSGLPGTVAALESETGRAVQKLLTDHGWCYSDEQIQFRNTVLIDLSASESELLERMKQKTRYNIRLASRKGITIRLGTPADYPLLYSMYAETSIRDSFTIRDEAYYKNVWTMFASSVKPVPSKPVARILIAEVAGEPVAALLLFMFAERAWYLYGMSRDLHRDKMPNYLLQWEAMRISKEAGCKVYDLWWAPDNFHENDPMWGVYRFKEGLGGTLIRTLGAWDYPAQPLIYKLYTQALPRILDFMRHRGQIKTHQFAG